MDGVEGGRKEGDTCEWGGGQAGDGNEGSRESEPKIRGAVWLHGRQARQKTAVPGRDWGRERDRFKEVREQDQEIRSPPPRLPG